VQEPTKARVKKKRLVIAYSELWHASGCVLESGLREPRGSVWQFLTSALLTAFSFEAYLNHIGPQVFLCWDSLEQLPPLAKFELLCNTLKVDFPKGKGERPLQTIIDLFRFRNTVAHAKPQTIEPEPVLRDINDNLTSFLGEKPLAHWERLIQDDSFAKRARKDVEVVLKKLQDARPEPKEPLFTFGFWTGNATTGTES